MKSLHCLKGLIALLFGVTTVTATPGSCVKQRDICKSKPKPKLTVKEITNFCETKPGLKSYAGHVTLPPSTNFPFEQNLFFWFFESRSNPKNDPLTVWINGGPGSPSTDQALGNNGPCRVLFDSKTTENNPWSWNTKSNLLYIDQPVQTGFSYDNIVDGQLGLLSGAVYPDGVTPPPEDVVLIDGTFSSQDSSRTLNTTQNVARVMWDFMQVWLSDAKFKRYAKDNIHLWSQSYGGHWVPAIASYFESQSALATSSPPQQDPSARLCSRPRPIRIASVGIIAGFVDVLLQNSALGFATNNTYGIEIFDQATVENMVDEFDSPGGCREQIEACRAAVATQDPEGWGNAPGTWGVCGAAFGTCWALVEIPYAATGLDPFDIAQTAAEQYPPPYAYGFLNRKTNQDKLGAKVNYTSFSNAVGGSPNFVITGDFLLNFGPQLESLLEADIPVHLIYGDRDWRSNWFGGEDLSLSLSYPGSTAFAAAGYADLVVSGDTYGYTRQHGRFSFTRMLQAGHEASYYQPEASYAIFQRSLDGKDIATGLTAVGSGSTYSTTGPSSVRDVMTTPPSQPKPIFCYIASTPLVPGQCTDDQIAALADGTAVVEDFIVVDPAWSA